MCWELSYKKVVCYSDSLNTLKLIEGVDTVYHKYWKDISLIHGLISRKWEVQLQHVFREANFYADFLAKRDIIDSHSHAIVDVPPHLMLQLLHVDALGLDVVRL